MLDARQATAEQLRAALHIAGLPGHQPAPPFICLDHGHQASNPCLLGALGELAEQWAEPSLAPSCHGPVLAVCCHMPPPPVWAEAQLHGQMRIVPHHELAFSADENLALASQRGVATAHALALRALTGGWVSGMALGLRYLADFPPVGDSLDEVSARLCMIVERKLLAGWPTPTRALFNALCALEGIPLATLDELGADGPPVVGRRRWRYRPGSRHQSHGRGPGAPAQAARRPSAADPATTAALP